MSHPRSTEIRARLKELDQSITEMRVMVDWTNGAASQIMLKTLHEQKKGFEADLFERASKQNEIPGALVGRIEQVDSQIRWIEDGFQSALDRAREEHQMLVEELTEIDRSEKEGETEDGLEAEQVATV